MMHILILILCVQILVILLVRIDRYLKIRQIIKSYETKPDKISWELRWKIWFPSKEQIAKNHAILEKWNELHRKELTSYKRPSS